MRWKKKQITPPKGGDRRNRRVFAWNKTPVKDYIVWLEFYQITELFFAPAGGSPGWWSEVDRDVLDYYP